MAYSPVLSKEEQGSSRPIRSVPQAVWSAVVVALLVRLAVIPFQYADRLDPWRGHWRFAWEMGMVARSLVTGKGFSSPFPPDTGATAWLAPVYPAVIAAVFRVCGLFTAESAIALLVLNSVFSALTCVPVFLIARKTIGERQARWASWGWALFPYAIYLSSGRIWENVLTTLLVTTLVWYTLVLEERGTTRLWIEYGALWAITALTNPGACALLPAFGLWIAWRRSGAQLPWLKSAVAGAIVFAALIAPWELRNELALHRLVPLRDNFWMEVRVGNTGDLSDIYPDWAHPGRSPRELDSYQRLGETAYLAHMKDLSVAFIRQYPGAFTSLCARRVVQTWTGFWSMDPGYRKNEPLQFPNLAFCTTVTVLALIGLRWMCRNRKEWTALYLIAVVVFPLVYYVTHPGIEYRHPIDPLIVILATAGVIDIVRRRAKAT